MKRYFSTTKKRKRPSTPKRRVFKKAKFTPKKRSFKKKSLAFQMAKRVGNAHWLTTTKIGIPKRFQYQGMVQSNSEGVNATFQIVCSVGRQSVNGTACNLYTPFDINTLNANPAQRSYLKHAKQHVWGTNQSNNNVYLYAYEVVAKSDIGDGGTAGNDPATSWAANADSTEVGNKPWSTQYFTSLWRIVKTTKYNLGQGESFEYVKDQFPNKWFDTSARTDQIDDAAANKCAIRNLTTYTLWVAHGAAYNDSGTTTQISSGVGTIDFITSKTYTYYNGITAQAPAFTDVLPQAFSVGQKIMNIDTGAEVDPIVA